MFEDIIFDLMYRKAPGNIQFNSEMITCVVILSCVSGFYLYSSMAENDVELLAAEV